MKNTNSGQWWQISTNLAVLLGVFLVVLQLQQNSDLLELQILKQDSDNFIENSMEVLPENFDETWLKAIDDPQNLTRVEIVNLDRFIWARSITRWRSLYDLYERGLLEESAWQRMIREEAEGLFGNPFGRAYWADIKEWETTLPDDLISAIDHAIAIPDGSSNSSSAFIDSMENRLGIDRK